MYKGLNEMNMEELICTDGGGVWMVSCSRCCSDNRYLGFVGI